MKFFLQKHALGSLGFVLFLGACTQSVAPYSHVILPVTNQFSAQEKVFEQQLKNDPTGFQTAASLAALYAAEAKQSGDMDRFDQAEILAQKSVALFPVFNDRAYLVLADVAQARHQFKESIEISQKLLDDSRTKRGARMEALSLLITAKLAQGSLTDALAAADRLVNLDSSVSTHLQRALVLEAQGRDEEMLHDYQTAYAREGFGSPVESAKLRAFWGRFYFRRGNYAKAKNLWKEGLRILPGDALITGYLADLNLKEGNNEDAERGYELAFSKAKQTVYLLGEIKAKQNRHQEQAAQDLRNQVEKLLRNSLHASQTSNQYAHRMELVRLLLDRGNPADVSEAVSLAQEELENRRGAETLFLNAEAYARAGDVEPAQQILQELLRTGVKQAEYFGLASQLAAQKKDKNSAQFYAQLACETNSHFDLKTMAPIGEDRRVAIH